MTWPALSDYQEAIQAPQLCFGDAELKRCVPATDVLGLPRTISGNFAVVFPVAVGRKRWAVRCFATYHPDQEARYQAISKHLRQVALPWMVDFQFLATGMRVRGQWYPILKMEWVHGEPLTRYIERNLGDRQALQELARQFLAMINDLRDHSIAHGDLQHGNILVLNGKLRLIDYDGMYAPGLDGMASHELGHRHYQHPARTERDFGPDIDNFSAWVIYLSLVGLSIEPHLWGRVGAGDEHLLFRREDYEHPASSATLEALRQLNDGTAHSIASMLESLARLPLTQVPAPDAGGRLDLPATAAQRSVGLAWLSDHVGKAASAIVPVPAVVAPDSAQLPDWVLDHLEPVPPKSFTGSCWPERFTFDAWVIIALGLAYVAITGLLPVLVALSIAAATLACLLGAAVCRYQFLPEVVDRRRLASNLRNQRSDTRRLASEIARLVKESDRCQQSEAEDMGRALRRIQARFRSEQQARSRLDSASIRGIGPEIKARLLAAGIETAADVDYQRLQSIPGIGGARAAALMSWRHACESQMQTGLPHTLLPVDEAAIRSKYQARSTALNREVAERRSELRAVAGPHAESERELESYGQICFVRYLRRIADRS